MTLYYLAKEYQRRESQLHGFSPTKLQLKINVLEAYLSSETSRPSSHPPENLALTQTNENQVVPSTLASCVCQQVYPEWNTHFFYLSPLLKGVETNGLNERGRGVSVIEAKLERHCTAPMYSRME